MSSELHADDEDVRSRAGADRERPNVSGDLPTLFQAGPMFRRTLAGYDRYQVDTYVRWAEDELVAADRQREHLLARSLQTQAALEEARTLLSHSSAGGEYLQVSRRVGSMLADAADEAATIRAEADNHRSVARAQAAVVAADARRALDEAEARAVRTLAEAATRATAMIIEAGRTVAVAEQAGRDVRAEAEAHLAGARAVEAEARAQADRIRAGALEEAAAARLSARAEVVRMLDTAREERRRADAAAATVRERLDRDAAAYRAALLAETAELEHRRHVLRTELGAALDHVVPSSGALRLDARGYVERIHGRLSWRGTPRRSPARVTAGDGGQTAA
jgi:hypothetical protein